MTRATRTGLSELAWQYGYHCWPAFQRQPDRRFLFELRDQGDDTQPRQFELNGRLSDRTLEEWEAADDPHGEAIPSFPPARVKREV